MKLGKRVLAASVGLTLALAFALKYAQEQPSREAQALKPVARPTMQRDPAAGLAQKVVPAVDHQVQHSDAMAVDWNQEFKTSTDYFPLIARAAKAALNGDGRAAYYVSKKWVECGALASAYGGTGEQPEAKFNEDLARYAALPPVLIEKKRKQFHDCAGFYNVDDRKGNDVFADLPPREGGYRSAQFWMDLAYQENDPVAQTVHAALSAGTSLAPTSGQLQVAQGDINHAIASGDPAAIYSAGMVITTNGLYNDRIEGYALSLAACDLGYDCTAANSNNGDFPFGECVAMGTCAPGETFPDWVTKNIGAAEYAKAYARAQQIKEAIVQGNLSALQRFAQLKG